MTNIASQAEWFAKGGLPEYVPEEPLSYAKRLSRYISNPSTVRIRTLEQFGRAPSVDTIRSFISERQMDHQYRAQNAFSYGIRYKTEKIAPVFKVKAATPPKSSKKPVLKLVDNGEDFQTWREVATRCAKMFGFTLSAIKGRVRTKDIVPVRNLIYAIVSARGNSLSQTGQRLGGRDHSTIIHGIIRFFSHDILRDDVREAWELLAPEGFGGLATYEEYRITLDKKNGTA